MPLPTNRTVNTTIQEHVADHNTAHGLLNGLNGTYARIGSNGGASIDPYEQGARGDYTGRVGTTGTGTDNRAAIQAALNAASDLDDATYYGYLTRRSTTVKLAPGHYWVSAPAGGAPSLVIPTGVTFDCSDATLYCDYPASATLQWAAIQVGQYAQLHVGRLVNSSKVAAPDALSVYDGVRMILTDNHSKVFGYKDSEISGFAGAGVRGIGAWITYVKGVRITSNHYGVIGSHFGDGFTYTMPGKTVGQLQNLRFATDIWLDDVIIVNCRKGGLIGGASGDAAGINVVSFDAYGAVVALRGCTIENIGTYAAYVANASSFSMKDCHLEECGGTDGVIYLDTVRVVTIDDLQYNLAGRTITMPDGTSGAAFPTDFFKFANVQTFSLDGLYTSLGAAYNPTMRLANTTPGHFSVGGIYYDADPFAAGTIPSGIGHQALSGKYNARHLILNGTHLWDDTTGLLRTKTSQPASAIDGTILGNTVGPSGGSAAVALLKPTALLAETVPRGSSSLVAASNGASGTLRLCAIALPAGVLVSSIGFLSSTQAAVAPTNQWFALFDSSRALLAITPDALTAAWAADTLKLLNVGTPFRTTYSGLYYLGRMITAGTIPNWATVVTLGPASGLVPILTGSTTDTGMTTPPTIPFTAGAITASTSLSYGGVA